MCFCSRHFLTLSLCCTCGCSFTLIPGIFLSVDSHFIGSNGVCFSGWLLGEQHSAFVQSKVSHIISSRAPCICLLPLHSQGQNLYNFAGTSLAAFVALLFLVFPSGCSHSTSAPRVRAFLASCCHLLSKHVWLQKMSSPKLISLL